MSTILDTDLFLVQRAATQYNIAAVDLKKAPVVPPALWTPADMTKIVWLDCNDEGSIVISSGNSISQLSDKSGNAHHATQSNASFQPQRSGTEVSFTNLNHYLDLGVLAALNNQPDIAFFICGRHGASGINRRQFSLTQTITERQVATRGGMDGTGDVFQFSVANSGAGSSSESRSTWSPAVTGRYLLGLDWRASRSANLGYGHRRNGTASTGLTSSGTNPATTPAAPTSTRVSSSDTTVAMGGFLTSLIVMRANDYDANIQKLEGWEAHRWGISSVLPAGHPYKSAPPTK
jgi:hypothetical protein